MRGPWPLSDEEERRVFATVLLLFLVLLAPIYGDNENRSHALMESVVSRRTIAVDGAPFPTGDLAARDGHLYSGGAPGLAFVGLVAYAPVRGVAAAAGAGDSAEVAGYLAATAFASAFPAAAGTVALLALARARGAPQDARVASAFAFALGSTLFPYAIRFMAHALEVGALALALAFADRAARNAGRGARPSFLAGLFAGVAAAADYPAAPAGLAVGLLVLVPREGRRGRALAFAAGLAIPAALVAAYHTAAFGSPVRTPYHFHASGEIRGVVETGWLGYALPSLRSVHELSFGSRVGLFVLCPIAVAGIAGAALATRRGEDPLTRAEAAVALAVTALYFLLNASRARDWHAGFGHGPRYMMAALPFTLAFLPEALARVRAPVRIVLLLLAFAVAWLGVQGTTHRFEDSADVLDRARLVLASGPRVPWLYVFARSFGVPRAALVPLLSAVVVLAACAACGLAWRRRDRAPLLFAGLVAVATVLHLKLAG